MSSYSGLGRYDIAKIAAPLFSYYQKIIPTEHTELIKFINAVILNSPNLVGLARRYSALLAGQVDFGKIKTSIDDAVYTDKVEKKLRNMLRLIKYQNVQNEIYYNLFFYPRVTATVMQVYKYTAECRECKAVVNLSEPYGKHFEFKLGVKERQVSLHGVSSGFKLSASFVCPGKKCKCNNSNRPVKVEAVKYRDDEAGFFVKIWNPYYTKVEKGIMRGRTFVVIDPDRFRKLYPERYASGGIFTFADIDNMDPNFLIAMLSGMPYIPNPDMTQVFTNEPQLAGMVAPMSPALLSMVGLLHTGSLRRGQEADAIIKASPHILLTPDRGEQSTQNTTLDGTVVNDMMMRMVKEVQEGNTTGIMHIPIPMTAKNLFADPRRTVLEREIKEEELGAIFTTGLDASFVSGGIGISKDPLIQHLLQEILGAQTVQMDEYSRKIVKMSKVVFKNGGTLPSDITYIPIIRLDEAPGTYIDQEYTKMAVEGGSLPMGPLFKNKYGFSSFEEAVITRLEEERTLAKLKMEYEMKIAEDGRTTSLKQLSEGMLSPQIMQQVEGMLEAQAEQEATKVSQMEEGMKKSYLDQMQKTNMLLYSLVKVKMEHLRNAQTQEAKDVVRQQNEGV